MATVVPNEKKSTAGVGGTARERDGPATESSVDTLAFPLVIEFGMNRFGFVTVDVSGSSFADCGAELNERAGAFPPPRTRSGCGGFAGATCFGAGNIDSNPDTPAPFPSLRAFFVGGCSGSSSPSFPLVGFRRSIVIFFGRLACFGCGRKIPGFGAVAGVGLTGAVVVVVVSASESLSLPLPYPSTPSMMMAVDLESIGLLTSRVLFHASCSS